MRTLGIWLWFLVCLFQTTTLKAKDIELEKFFKPVADAKITDKAIYPDFLRENDQISLDKIYSCLKVRYEFVIGITPENYTQECHKILDQIENAIKIYNAEHKTPIRQIDSDLILNTNSPLKKYIRRKITKISGKCSFSSSGDLTQNGVIYCKYHGISYKSDSFKIHAQTLDSMRPMFNSDDIADLLIFFPALLLFISIGAFALRKFLAIEKG